MPRTSAQDPNRIERRRTLPSTSKTGQSKPQAASLSACTIHAGKGYVPSPKPVPIMNDGRITPR